ncbi:MAG: cellulase family glycosylhydrolase [Isosphaeraceae bacterium]
MTHSRRDFLRLTLAGATAPGLAVGWPSPTATAADPPRALPDATPARLPRWRGFNLLNKFNAGHPTPFEERDFADIAELGFDFVRLPMDYRCWTDASDPRKLREPVLKEIDQAVEFGKKYGVHVQINFHRAPGFTVAKPPEPKSLWSDPEPLALCAQHWAAFAARSQGIPNNRVSFNLFNEPDDKVKPEAHRRVVERVAASIRERDSNRLIVCDGRSWATKPPTELVGLNVAAALHDYNPMPLTHYKASWVNWTEDWPEPTWPLTQADGKVVGRGTIAREVIQPWKELQAQGVGVMVGEFGCHNQAPHRFVLSWMNDTLQEFKKAGFGWALWNFTGSFGVFDSGRFDVSYGTWHGRKVDRGMLELLQAN